MGSQMSRKGNLDLDFAFELLFNYCKGTSNMNKFDRHRDEQAKLPASHAVNCTAALQRSHTHTTLHTIPSQEGNPV